MGTRGRAADAQFRLLGHLDLGDQAARRRLPPGKRDSGRLTDQAASPVAPDEIRGPERPAARERDVDAGVVLCEAGDLGAVVGRHPQLADPVGQDALDVVLPQREPVRVPTRKIADVQPGRGEPRDLSHLPLREEPVGDAALVEDLEGARRQASCARTGERLTSAALEDRHVDACQRQLARQHQPCRTAPGNHHRRLAHRRPPASRAAPNAPDCTASPTTLSASLCNPNVDNIRIQRLHFRRFWLRLAIMRRD